MPDYDIVQAFHEIESELIRSMMGNFKRHRAEETTQGYNWTQWQAEQLKYLNEYIRENQETFPERFDDINEQIDQMLAIAAASGEADQEADILKAIRQGYTPPHTPSQGLSGGFFSLNGRKLDALRKATQSDFNRAEYAVLRKANDAYRKIIFNAQVYANTGAGTYEKAVDMAARDFLRAGINSIVYKNGSTHTIDDYADMAIRTASKRAYLMGEGSRRAEWGIRKVVVNSRIGACPRCGQYVGKVFIDDVYSGGSKADGDEPLLSEAIRGGLFHPRCKDSTSTYFEGITTLKPMTEEEMEEMDRREKEEARQAYHEREAEKNQRIADNSLDPDNKKAYAHRAEEHRKKAVQIAEKPVANSGESGIIRLQTDGRKRQRSKTYSERGIELPKELKSYLNELINEGDFIKRDKGTFSMSELSELSKESGVEYACVTVNDETFLIRGNENGTTIPQSIFEFAIQNGGTLDYHSHPHDGDCIPSISDIEVLGVFQKYTGQETSIIISTDNLMSEFDVHGVREMKSIPSKREGDYEKLLQELFGGE